MGQVIAEALGDKAGCNRMGRAVAAVAAGKDVVSDADAAAEEEGGEGGGGDGSFNRPYLANGVSFATSSSAT